MLKLNVSVNTCLQLSGVCGKRQYGSGNVVDILNLWMYNFRLFRFIWNNSLVSLVSSSSGSFCIRCIMAQIKLQVQHVSYNYKKKNRKKKKKND